MFKIENTLSFNTDELTDGYEYDYVTRTSQNQGVLQQTGFVNSENINESGCWSLGLLQMDFFYRPNQWYAGQFVRKIIPKIEISPNAVHYFSSALNSLKPKLLSVLVRSVDATFLNSKLTLPIKKNGKIDFEFIEDFIGNIVDRNVQELDSYLIENGLTDFSLSIEEENALKNYKNVEWKEFRMSLLFEKIKTKKISYKADELPKHIKGNFSLPCLTSSFKNQGLNYFVPKDNVTVLKNVISIPSNSDVYRAYYQSNEFTVLSDAYAIRWVFNNTKLSDNQYLFAVQCINKVTDLSTYSYKNKLGGWNVVKEKSIQLPVKNQKPDHEFMDILVSAIQKLAIKDVVLYVRSKLKNQTHFF